jgi:hypothetical protein
LEDCHEYGLTHIVSWKDSGRSFQIHNKRLFETVIMPKYFETTRFKSFQRSLNLWGFYVRKPQDADRFGTAFAMDETVETADASGMRCWNVPNQEQGGECYHPHFVRGNPGLCHRMERIKKKTDKTRGQRPPSPSSPRGERGSGSSESRSGGDGGGGGTKSATGIVVTRRPPPPPVAPTVASPPPLIPTSLRAPLSLLHQRKKGDPTTTVNRGNTKAAAVTATGTSTSTTKSPWDVSPPPPPPPLPIDTSSSVAGTARTLLDQLWGPPAATTTAASPATTAAVLDWWNALSPPPPPPPPPSMPPPPTRPSGGGVENHLLLHRLLKQRALTSVVPPPCPPKPMVPAGLVDDLLTLVLGRVAAASAATATGGGSVGGLVGPSMLPSLSPPVGVGVSGLALPVLDALHNRNGPYVQERWWSDCLARPLVADGGCQGALGGYGGAVPPS